MIFLNLDREETDMLHIARKLKDLSFFSLMEVYEESNRENAAAFRPDVSAEHALQMAEQEFYQYLREVFFPTPSAVYALWTEEEKYRSALRLEPYRDGLLLSALETAPEHRNRGYAEALVRGVLAQFPDTKIYSHVHKSNLPSLKLHEKCGFQRISEQAAYLDGSVNDKCCTMRYVP